VPIPGELISLISLISIISLDRLSNEIPDMERQTMREIPQSQKGSRVTGTGEASSSGQQQPQRQAATNLILDYEKIARKKRKQAARLREIEKEMLEKAAKRPVIDISPEEKRIMIQDLRNILSTLARVIKTTPLYYYLTGNERVIRKLVMIVSNRANPPTEEEH
jgi:hypothetical protein